MVRKYSNPPLEEVLCEFRFRPSDQWDLAIPGLIYQELGRDKYPQREQVRLPASATISAGPTSVRQETRLVDRVRFLSEDRKTIVQIGSDLLSVHRLKPYESWEHFKQFVEEGFDAYLKPTGPRELVGLRLRYIDQLEIPVEVHRLREYLSFGPFTGEELSACEQFSSFIVGIQSPHENDRDRLRMELITVEPGEDAVRLGLDTQYILYHPDEVGLDKSKILNWLNQAHKHVNRAFEACLTDKLRALFMEVPV